MLQFPAYRVYHRSLWSVNGSSKARAAGLPIQRPYAVTRHGVKDGLQPIPQHCQGSHDYGQYGVLIEMALGYRQFIVPPGWGNANQIPNRYSSEREHDVNTFTNRVG